MVERRLRLAFSTGPTRRVEPVPQEALNPLFYAAIEATEEAIVNALLAAETMTGRGGATVHALEPSLLEEAMGLLRSSAGQEVDTAEHDSCPGRKVDEDHESEQRPEPCRRPLTRS